jgi:4-diphosphocytidyl-2C-methyl-D-erythritol kinase
MRRVRASQLWLPCEVSAPAKVNLILRVAKPRPDGLHEICSLFQSVSLADRLVIRRRSASR